MIYNSRMLALSLSASIAVVSTILVWLFVRDMATSTVLVLFFAILIVSFVFLYLALQKGLSKAAQDFRERLRNLGVRVRDQDSSADNFLQDLSADIHAMLEEKQREIDRLKKLEAFRKDFIADVSHELKTPIFAAQGFVHTLLDGAVKEKAVRKKFLKKAAKSLDGLDMLVQDLLTLSQIETGQIKMRFEDTDLRALAEEVIEQFKSKVSRRNITLRIEGPARKISAYADPRRVEQVMSNLISNAIKHSDEGGEVVVGFSVRKKSVVTRIKDSGEGIPAEHINRIFERFYRVDKSRSREKGGTGLGLAIVKHILEGHNSKAEVESEPGKGSTFSFKLPRANNEEKHGASENNE